MRAAENISPFCFVCSFQIQIRVQVKLLAVLRKNNDEEKKVSDLTKGSRPRIIHKSLTKRNKINKSSDFPSLFMLIIVCV